MITQSRPRYTVKEADDLMNMLGRPTTCELAGGLLAFGQATLPWRYVKQLKRQLQIAPANLLDDHVKKEMIRQQCNKRSRIELKKIYGKETEDVNKGGVATVDGYVIHDRRKGPSSGYSLKH